MIGRRATGRPSPLTGKTAPSWMAVLTMKIGAALLRRRWGRPAATLAISMALFRGSPWARCGSTGARAGPTTAIAAAGRCGDSLQVRPAHSSCPYGIEITFQFLGPRGHILIGRDAQINLTEGRA